MSLLSPQFGSSFAWERPRLDFQMGDRQADFLGAGTNPSSAEIPVAAYEDGPEMAPQRAAAERLASELIAKVYEIACTKGFAIMLSDRTLNDVRSALETLRCHTSFTQELHLMPAYLRTDAWVRKICVDEGIFSKLAEHYGTPLSTEELIPESCASENINIINRILIYAAAVGMINRVGPSMWLGNWPTTDLAEDAVSNAMLYSSSCLEPISRKLPQMLEEHRYSVSTPEKAPFQLFHSLSTPSKPHGVSHLDWVESDLWFRTVWMKYQTMSYEGGIMSRTFPIEKVLGPVRARETLDSKFFVNLSGPINQASEIVAEEYPQLCGSIVTQDHKALISRSSDHGILHHRADWLLECRFKNARCYYVRDRLQYHSDLQCRQILKNIGQAMASHSRLVIDEMTYEEDTDPEDQSDASPSTTRLAACVDLEMILFGGKLRSRQQWATLLHDAGLDLVETFHYGLRSRRASLTIAMLPEVSSGSPSSPRSGRLSMTI